MTAVFVLILITVSGCITRTTNTLADGTKHSRLSIMDPLANFASDNRLYPKPSPPATISLPRGDWPGCNETGFYRESYSAPVVVYGGGAYYGRSYGRNPYDSIPWVNYPPVRSSGKYGVHTPYERYPLQGGHGYVGGRPNNSPMPGPRNQGPYPGPGSRH
jgi:hypothetical protein